MKIQVLGSGCATCKTLHKTVEELVTKLGIQSAVEYSTDIAEIAKLGAMSSPVFAIDGKIISAGKVPSLEEIENALSTNSSSNKECETKKTVQKKSCCCSGNKEKEVKAVKKENPNKKYCPILAIKKLWSKIFSK